MGTQNREILKSFFKTDKIPTESNFSDLIDSFVNQADDGLSATPGVQQVSGTLSVTANSNIVKGTNSNFLAELHRGDLVTINQGATYTITDVTANDSFTINTNVAVAVTNGTATAKRDIFAVLDAAGNVVFKLSGNGQAGTGRTQTAFNVSGGINAGSFTGDGSRLTGLSSANLKGLIPKELIPQADPVNVSTINGTLTVNEAYDLQLAGTVTGKSGEAVLTGTGTDFSKLTVGQKISVAAQMVEVSAIADNRLTLRNPLPVAVTDKPIFVAGSFLALKDVNNVQVLNIDGKGSITTPGSIQAGSFTGDGSKLTGLSSANLKGLIPKEVIPPADPVNVSAIDGLLTISEAYDQKLEGTVTGKSGGAVLTGTGTDFKEIVAGQKIVIAPKTYEVLSSDSTTLTLKANLTEDITDQPVYIAGSFLSLKDVNAAELLSIDGKANIRTSGSLTADSFTGDGSKLTGLSSANLKGLIPKEIIPPTDPVNVSAIDGLLTISEAYDQKLAGTVTGKSGGAVLTGTGTDFKEIVAGRKIVIATKTYEVLNSDATTLTLKANLTEDITDQPVYLAGSFLSLIDVNAAELLRIDAKANLTTSGSVTADSFTGDGSKLTSLSTVQLKGIISADNLPPDVFTTDVNGLLTITQIYDQQLAGTVSGTKGEDTLTVKNVNLNLLSTGQKIRITSEVFQVKSITDDKLILEPALADTITDQPVFMAGSFLSLKDVNATEVLTVNAVGTISSSGTVNAKGFTGDGSGLINLSALAIEGVIPDKNLPPERPVRISEIDGLLTIVEAYDRELAGEVSGTKDGVVLTGTGTSFAVLSPGQKIRVSTQVAEVLSINGETLTLKNPLTDTVTDQSVYIAGNFLSLKDINNTEVLAIDAEGNVAASGSLTAKDFTGDGSKLSNIDVAALKGVISVDNLPPGESSSNINGLLTVNGAYDRELIGTVSGEKDSTTLTGTGTNFKTSLSDGQKIRIATTFFDILTVSSDTELTLQAPIAEKLDNQGFFAAGDFLSLIDTDKRNIATINGKGDVYTHGTVTAGKFAGDGFLLYALQASQMQGVVAPEQTPGYISLSCSGAVVNGEEKTTLTWHTRSLDNLIVEYPFNGRRELLSTGDLGIPSARGIALQQPSFDLNLYQTTTITLTGVKKGVGVVAQQQVTITVIQNANQFTAQLKYEGYNLAYILISCGARFGLYQLTEQNLLTVATAIKNNGFGKDEAVAAIQAYYKNGGQTWDPSVYDLILNQVFDGDLQYQVNNAMMLYDTGTELPDLLKAISEQFNLNTITDQNVKYLATGTLYTRRYTLTDIFRFIPQFFRSAGGEWLPQQHGVILLVVCSK